MFPFVPPAMISNQDSYSPQIILFHLGHSSAGVGASVGAGVGEVNMDESEVVVVEKQPKMCASVTST